MVIIMRNTAAITRNTVGRPIQQTHTMRKVKTLRASEAEWQVIKKFADYVKAQGIAKAEKLLAGV